MGVIGEESGILLVSEKCLEELSFDFCSCDKK